MQTKKMKLPEMFTEVYTKTINSKKIIIINLNYNIYIFSI